MDLKELQQNWERMGQTDPLYGVLSHSGKKNRRWDDEEFFETGRREIIEVMSQAKELGFQPSGTALDFGCAVGRLTQALCPYFESCVGVDIAPSMLEKAREYNRFGDRCRYVLNEKEDLSLFADESFNFVYSALVLQHMAPRYAVKYIGEFMRLLKPGGFAVFQVPPRPQYHPVRRFLKKLIPRRLLFYYRRLRYGRQAAVEVEIEMNGLPREEVFDVVTAGRGILLKEQNHVYWAAKKAEGG